jgi:predicted GNAT family N-acyltransferase
MTIQFQVKQTSWEESKRELIRIRTVVFINEQLVPPELEWDGYDQDCWHVLAQTTDGKSIGTGRMLYDGHIGRMAVLPQYRKTGVGSALLRELIKIARLQGINEVFLHAQTQAAAFYQKHGFVITSDEFMDAGIPHVTMRLILAKTV